MSEWTLQGHPAWQVILPAALLLVVGAIAILVLQRYLTIYLRRIAQHSPMTTGTAVFLRRGIASALWVILGLIVLRQVGVNVDGIWALLASTLAVIGVGLLAVWTMASNITASLFIWIWRPYEMGDQLELLPDEIAGRAVDRTLMFTSLRAEDGSVLRVPNNLFFQRIIRIKPTCHRLTEYEAWESEQGGTLSRSGHAATTASTPATAVQEGTEVGGNSSA